MEVHKASDAVGRQVNGDSEVKVWCQTHKLLFVTFFRLFSIIRCFADICYIVL